MPPLPPDAPLAEQPRHRRLKAPRTVRREIRLETLHPDVWDAATAAAERAFGRPGVTAGTRAAPRWTAGPTRGRSEIALWGDADRDGVRLVAEHIRPESRPYVLMSVFLCIPIGVLAAVVLSARTATLEEWAVVVSLLAVPFVVAVWVGAAAWGQTLLAGRRLRRVMAVAARAARTADPALTADEAEAEAWDDAPEPTVALDALPPVGPSEWLTAEEMASLTRRDVRVRQARVVAQATAERQRAAPVAPSAAEWL
ncbi:hypothetical protein [Rubrivirga sp. IMCC43871]|uniref:hypothetical protein n=1 Tax=Rubrivirga sp. IMCC43871 TaxID=3391575 RepID=UPI00398FA480